MSNSYAHDSIETILRTLCPEWSLRDASPLTGGVSATILKLAVANGDTEKSLLLRIHGEGDRRVNPGVANDEFRLLDKLFAEGIPVPRPIGVDKTTLDAPALLVEFIEGETEFSTENWETIADCFALFLERLHAISTIDVDFLSRRDDLVSYLLARERPPNERFSESEIRDVLAKNWPLPSTNRDVLLHGDLWPGNAIWRNGALAGVIDWEDACIGDPLADIAGTRLEMVIFFSEDACERFTQSYRLSAAIDFENLACWDLAAALKMACGIENWGMTEEQMDKFYEGHARFINRAFNAMRA